MVDGVPRVETHLEWQMTPHTDPSWNIKGCYITQIKGDPCVYNKHMIFPKPGVDLSNPDNFASIGMTVTGLPALNALKSVVAAPPGLLTSADLPLRGFAGRFKAQWATGNVGQRALRAVLDRDEFELVGVHAFSSDKIGRDAGTLAGIAPVESGNRRRRHADRYSTGLRDLHPARDRLRIGGKDASGRHQRGDHRRLPHRHTRSNRAGST